MLRISAATVRPCTQGNDAMKMNSHWLDVEAVRPRAPRRDANEGEPLLAIGDIQGHILPGFGRDFAAFTFFSIRNVAAFRVLLRALAPTVTTMANVLAHRGRIPAGGGAPAAVWTAVAFTAPGLRSLREEVGDLGFADEAFVAGQYARSQMGLLGDPRGTGTEGDPDNWRFGCPARAVDGVLIQVSDDERALHAAVDAFDAGAGGALSVVFRQSAVHLPGARRGHEHFGFLDDISQPGVRGEVLPGRPLTARENPHDSHQGKPGQDLVWPGEFMFGYPGQSAALSYRDPGDDPLLSPTRRAPGWARNGSFLVVRRLRQDVGAFHRFVHDNARALGVAPDFLASRLMGRWPSGCPVVLSPDADRPDLGRDEDRRNAFEYNRDRFSPPADGPGALPNDPDGLACPLSSHIRKAFPRNDRCRDLAHLDRAWTHTRRMLRRGIPWGAESVSRFEAPEDDTLDRGLFFLCHVVSIRDQFEYVIKRMINDHNFRESGHGYDPIIGQNDTLPDRFRAFKVPIGGELRTLNTTTDWVIPTGGDYFFTPSLSCIAFLAAGGNGK